MKITLNPIPLIGGILAWHWYGWHMFVVTMLLTSSLTFVFNDVSFGFAVTLWDRVRGHAEKRDVVSVARPGTSIGRGLK